MKNDRKLETDNYSNKAELTKMPAKFRVTGLYTYFTQLDRDESGLLEKDEVECKSNISIHEKFT